MVIINKGKTIVEGAVKDLLDANDLQVRIETDDVVAAKQVIVHAHPHIEVTLLNAREMEFPVHKDQVHLMNQLLVNAGIAVHAIEPKRKLEDYFMNIISSEHVA
jgi:ABC-2 type transport system ATP-binding protein